MTATDPTELRRDVVRTALDRLWEHRNAPPRAMDPAGRAMDRMRAEVARYGWALAEALERLQALAPTEARALALVVAEAWDCGETPELLALAAERAGIPTTIHRSGS